MGLKMKKSQIVTFDLAISLIIFILFIGAFVSLYFLMQKRNSEGERDFEIEYVYANLENNLEFRQKTVGDYVDFLKNYRIDRTKLNNFFRTFKPLSVDDFVVGEVSGSHGIGMSADNYDVCMYLTDNDGTSLVVETVNAVGHLKTGSCNLQIATSQNPCAEYSQGISLLKPVLMDENDYTQSRILQLNIVLCKK